MYLVLAAAASATGVSLMAMYYIKMLRPSVPVSAYFAGLAALFGGTLWLIVAAWNIWSPGEPASRLPSPPQHRTDILSDASLTYGFPKRGGDPTEDGTALTAASAGRTCPLNVEV